MKRSLSLLAVIVLLAGSVWAAEAVIDRDNLSLKAGPTQPGEGLSLVWVESLVYPKTVREDRVISLGVRTANRVKTVKALFDFTSERIELASKDGVAWSGTYKLPTRVGAGVHVVRYQIAGERGAIQRTVEFFVETPSATAAKTNNVSQGEAYNNIGWPLTVVVSCSAVSNDSRRVLKQGEVLTAISRLPWYKVVFDDGKEGWVSSANVKEPTEDFFRLGCQAYNGQNYSAAIIFFKNMLNVDARQAKAYLWLAKTYLAQNELSAASESLGEALRLDDRDMESRKVANALAQKFYDQGNYSFRFRRYHDAVAQYRQAVDLRADLTQAYIRLGECLRALGLREEARDAWKEGLRNDPDNNTLQSLLGRERTMVAAASPVTKPMVLAARGQGRTAVSSLVADDSLKIVLDQKTGKGTKLEAAIKSVVALTKSLGTPVVVKGWQIRKKGEKAIVKYVCEQSGGALETFDWLVDVDTRQVLPGNDNARLLMSRW